MPAWDVADDVQRLGNAIPAIQDDLLDDVARPPKVVTDKSNEKKFIACNYN